MVEKKLKPLDMFLSILSENNSHASYFCHLNGLDKNIIVDFLEHKYNSDKSIELVQEYTTNLNEEAQKAE